MGANSRLTIASHALVVIAHRLQKYGEQYDFCTSQEIADSVNTNPVILRELLGMMEKQHLVRVQRGCNAGWKLARQPEEITLLDVYHAVKPGSVFAMHHTPPNPHCQVGNGISSVLKGVYANVQHTLEQELANTTIADILRDSLAGSSTYNVLIEEQASTSI
ncbi:Rrf2 family transcriptional regulator [Ktedonospora formicarum]|uniref:Rrf2 family transcriptional regulator n=1 Tax=Ktedonospora formicarum TaxID=2778364 RepID=A0A8J3I0Q2_9CHLR|nr:Rrf2 family transcriptional regulator [Ktedonospora formicarum]GHO46671.1 Rrf2 family transcriptional regulator [Ktedonospora formicarum]